jgi:hypothetical protein
MAGCRHAPAPDGLTLLADSHRAEESLCYTSREVNEQVVTRDWPGTGSMPVMYGRPVTTLLVRTESPPHQERYEVLHSNASAADARMVRVRTGRAVWSFVPSQRRLEYASLPVTDMGPLNWYALILNNYRVEGVREDRVANLRAWYLEVRPKHPGRPMTRLWLDQATYLPLRRELWGPDGVLISATQVTQRPTQHASSNPEDFRPPASPRDPGVTTILGDTDVPADTPGAPPLAAWAGGALGRFTEMPAGFRVVGAYLHDCPDTFGHCARWEMTDGIATVSVIQTRANTEALHDSMAPEDVQGSIETVRRGPFHFIVQGNVSSRELRRIANGIRLESPARPR